MPLFRIMGGREDANSDATHNRGNNRSSANTYPGLRAAAAGSNPHSLPSLPTEPPRTGLMTSTTAPPRDGASTLSAPSVLHNTSTISRSVAQTGQVPPSNTVIRGSQVASNARAPPPAAAVETKGSNVVRPGAYLVSRTSSGPAQVYRVTVPQGVRPGTEFTVHAGPRRVRVRCPPTSAAGQSLQITLPPEPITHHLQLQTAPLTANSSDEIGGGTVPMTPEVQQVNQAATNAGATAQTFLVTIPPNIYPGMQFTVNVAGGQRFMVTCPSNAGPNMKVRIVPPTAASQEPTAAPKTQVFEVAVPPGVQPGQPFALVANGQRVLVTCPPNVAPGQKIRFQLPVAQVVGNIQLAYESQGGWRRTIRVTDLKFQWVKLDKKDKDNEAEAAELVDQSKEFDFSKSAFVRHLVFLEGNDARMRTGTVELVAADEAVVDSRLVVHNRTLLSYADISATQGKSLEAKTAWFQGICQQLTSAWEDGHIRIVVRRRHLLPDSVDAVMALGRDDLRKRWRIEFLGEPAIDAGGVTREWFELVTQQVFDPDFGLWLSSRNNQACCDINTASALLCPDDHLIYFRFLGRVIGRALFDKQLIKGHMVRSIYKHLLGWPITFEDIQNQDEEYYNSLKKLTKMEDVSLMCLDFTVTEDNMGDRQEVELVEGGSMKEVTNDNISDYLEANLKYRMLERNKPQLTELLLGFYDVVPEPALTVFDANELELILCGLPSIDMEDWKANTNYSGLFEGKGRSDKVVEWFWEVVEKDFDQEMRARLLQFVTGTSGVPARGFSVLQGIDGNIKLFTVHGVDHKAYPFPRAHTCFNRIDLPNYLSKKELYEKLKVAITMSGVGFGIE